MSIYHNNLLIQPTMTTSKQQVLAILAERNVELPDDGVTVEKIRRRGTHFDVVENEYLSFRLERHPTMYLSDSLPGHDQSPARFHVRTEYRLSLDTETWSVEELESTFDFDPHLVIQAELDALGIKQTFEQEIEAVKRAENSEAEFNERFDSWIEHWEGKFAEVHGRPVPDNQREEMVRLLVNELRSRAGLN